MVTNHEQYGEMVASFRAHGFDRNDCEYLYLDNSAGNSFDAFVGVNIFLRDAIGEFIIVCHQDILLVDDDREILERCLGELSDLDPAWALCGNSGSTLGGENVVRISDPHGANQARGSFPAQAASLDENFIVVRADANLTVSHDLKGFHLYGADLCIIADILGRSAWVINFHLLHKSGGKADSVFFAARTAFIAKYQRAFRTRKVRTPSTEFYLRPSMVRRLLRIVNPQSP